MKRLRSACRTLGVWLNLGRKCSQEILVLFARVLHLCFVRFACFACVFLLFLHVLHVCVPFVGACFACVLRLFCMFLHVFLLFCMFCLQFDYYFSNGLRPALRIQTYDTDASNLK